MMVLFLIATHLLAAVFGAAVGTKWVILTTERGRELVNYMVGVRASMYRGFAYKLRKRLAEGYLIEDAIDHVVRKAYEEAALTMRDDESK